MPACEKCWSDSETFDGNHSERYRAQMKAVHKSGAICTPEEQAGRDAKRCRVCGRFAVHQYADVCMACGVRA